MTGTAGRALVGATTIAAVVAVAALAVGSFRNEFTDTVPLTVMSQRAGLVMNPDAKVRLLGVPVGRVGSIEERPEGLAAIHLEMDPDELAQIPDNVVVDITSPTVFGAKSVNLVPPTDPSPRSLRPGQVLDSQHVTVEFNSIFEQLVSVLTKIQPEKLNETLGALASAFDGRGDQFGDTLSQLNQYLAKIEPSLPNLSRAAELAPPVLAAYADAAPDLLRTAQNATTISTTLVAEQQNLDAFLVSTIGLADTGNDVIGGNRQGLTDLVAILVPTLDLTNRYNSAITCTLAGMVPLATGPPLDERHRRLDRFPAGPGALPLSRQPPEGCGDGRSALPDAAERSLRLPSAVRRRRRRRQSCAVRKPGHPAELRRTQATPVRPHRRASAQHRPGRSTGMSSTRGTFVKFGSFALVMALLTGLLVLIFGQYRTGTTNAYSAVFADVSGLRTGDSVRAGGLRVGTVDDVSMNDDHTIVVTFDADRAVPMSTGTKVAVRYLNLVGDRFLDLVDGPGSTRILPAGSRIPMDRTTPALDLDLLLGGLKPVVQGLNPQDVNALSAALLQIFQGQGGTLDSLLAKTSSFTEGLADNGQVIQQLIDNLNTVVGVLADSGTEFSGAIDRLERLVTELSVDRDPVGKAIESLDAGTTSLADLLGQARAPLAGSIDQLTRLAPLLDDDKDLVDAALGRAPDNYRKLIRLGAYGSWLNIYICSLSFRVTDLQGNTAVFPWFKQPNGRCAE